MRSLTDEALAARHDPQPFERDGERADEAHAQPDFEPGPFGKMIEASRWTFAPRVEMIPGRLIWDRDAENVAPGRPPVNPILRIFRVYVATSDLNAAAYAADWLERDLLGRDSILVGMAAEEIDHARKVLSRLAVLS